MTEQPRGCYTGFMKKKGAGIMGYKRRWFEIHGIYLYYYKSPGDKPMGVLNLKGAKASDDDRIDSDEGAFCLEGSQLSRKYKFICESRYDKTHWLYHLSLAGVACVCSNDSLAISDTSLPTESGVCEEDFDVVRLLGKGSFGKVELVRRKKTGILYASKSIPKPTTDSRSFKLSEIKVLQKLDHPFIVSLNFAYLTPTSLCLVLCYLPGGELFQHIRREGHFSEERAAFYAAEIALALDFLHANKIIYRDLKPENCVLDGDGHVVLTDFGLAKITKTNDSALSTFCGTHEYLAPELLQGFGSTKAADWWSWGILLFEMTTGSVPFFTENNAQLYNMILQDEVTYPACLSSEAISVMSISLKKDPAVRVQNSSAISKHPFFSLDWDLLAKRGIEPPYKPEEDHGKPSLDIHSSNHEQIGSVSEGVGTSGSYRDPFADFTWNG